MKKLIAASLLALLLNGCAYDLTLMKRGSSEMAYGHASQSDKTVEITLQGKIYRGHYTFVQQGFTTFSTGFASSGMHSAWGNSVGYAAASAGEGNVLARSEDGHGLRCRFSFSGDTHSGMGECQDDTGAMWDMQIQRAGPTPTK